MNGNQCKAPVKIDRHHVLSICVEIIVCVEKMYVNQVFNCRFIVSRVVRRVEGIWSHLVLVIMTKGVPKIHFCFS